MAHDDELDALRERLAGLTMELVEAKATMESTLTTFADNIDLLLRWADRHQAHHEAVEHILGNPLGREIAATLLSTIDAQDVMTWKALQEERKKVINPKQRRTVDLGIQQ
jgi:hypothetical protein